MSIHTPIIAPWLNRTPEQKAAWTVPVVTEADTAAHRAQRLASTPNLMRLEAFVSGTLEAAPDMEHPLPFLRAQVAFIQAKLRALSAWAGQSYEEGRDDEPCPADIEGLTALDLSSALDRLNAAIVRAEHAQSKAA